MLLDSILSYCKSFQIQRRMGRKGLAFVSHLAQQNLFWFRQAQVRKLFEDLKTPRHPVIDAFVGALK